MSRLYAARLQTAHRCSCAKCSEQKASNKHMRAPQQDTAAVVARHTEQASLFVKEGLCVFCCGLWLGSLGGQTHTDRHTVVRARSNRLRQPNRSVEGDTIHFQRYNNSTHRRCADFARIHDVRRIHLSFTLWKHATTCQVAAPNCLSFSSWQQPVVFMRESGD